MTNTTLLPLVLLATCSLLGGCVPVTHLDASPVAGRVIDRATRRPLVGAEVVLSVSSPDRERRTQTAGDGRFCLPGLQHVELIALPYAMYRAPTGYLHVRAAGYQPYDRCEFFDTDEGPAYSARGTTGTEQQVRVELVRGGSPHTR